LSEDAEKVFEFLYHLIRKEARIENSKSAAIASQFSTLDNFKKTDFLNTKFSRADKTEIRLNAEQRKRIQLVKKHVNPDSDIKENWIKYLANNFVETQLTNIGSLSLERHVFFCH